MFFNKKLLTKSREKLAAIRDDLAIPFEDAINFTPKQQQEIALNAPDGDFIPLVDQNGEYIHLGKGSTGYANAGYVNPRTTGIHNSYIDLRPEDVPVDIQAKGKDAVNEYIRKNKQLGNASVKFEHPGGGDPAFAGQVALARQIMDSKGSNKPTHPLFPIVHSDIGGPDSTVTPRLVTADYLGLNNIKGSYAAVRDFYNQLAEMITQSTDPSKHARGLGLSQYLRRDPSELSQIDQMLIRNPTNGELYETSDLMMRPSRNGGRLTQKDLWNILFDPSNGHPVAFDPLFFKFERFGQYEDDPSLWKKTAPIQSALTGPKTDQKYMANKLRAVVGQLGNLIRNGASQEELRKFLFDPKRNTMSNDIALSILNDYFESRLKHNNIKSKDPLSLLGNTVDLNNLIRGSRGWWARSNGVAPDHLINFLRRWVRYKK